MKRILILTTFALFVAVLTSAAMAQGGPGQCGQQPMMGQGPGCQMHQGKMGGHGRMGDGHGILTMADELGLTDQQIEKIKGISFSHQNAMIDLQADLKKAELVVHQEMTADKPDKAKVLSAATVVNTLKGKIEEARISHRFDIHGILTAEQLDKLTELRKDRPERRGRDDQPGQERPHHDRGYFGG